MLRLAGLEVALMNRVTSQPQTLPRTASRRGMTARTREAIWGFVFIAPWIIGFLVFSLFPILSVFYLGFTKYNVLQPPRWIGLDNYIEMFTADRLYYTSLYNTLYYIGFRVPSWIVIGLTLAILLNRQTPGISVYRTVFYLPTIIPLVASSMIWLWMLNPQFGFLNTFLREFGIVAPNWLRDPVWAKPAIVILGIWQLGQTMMIFLAGLQEIPPQLYEAAKIDGANRFQQLFVITVPMMTPTIYFNVVMGIIASFQVFGSAFIMTGGGPVNSTLFYVLYIYRHGFEFLDMGYASAMSVILFLLILALTILIVLTSDRWVRYERI
jgi:multiple sugar transport system permease protein